MVYSIAHQVRVQVEGSGEVSSIVLLRWTAVHHKEPHALLEKYYKEEKGALHTLNTANRMYYIT